MISNKTHFKFKIDSNREIELAVPKGVFVPTGTTYALFKAVCSHVSRPGKMLDLGCGSGVVGIALHQIGLVNSPLYASDLSEQAVECIINNAVLHHCPIVAKCGSLLDPWKNESFDYIVNDVSGIAEEAAKFSPWFNDVPCESGTDGISLVVEVIRKAPSCLNAAGLFFFPVISFSNVKKILTAVCDKFSHVKLLNHKEWPLPKEMYQHLTALKKLKKEGHIHFKEKYGMVIYFTDIYVAYNT